MTTWSPADPDRRMHSPRPPDSHSGRGNLTPGNGEELTETLGNAAVSILSGPQKFELYTQKKCEFDRPFHDQELGQPLSCSDMLMAVPESTQKKCKFDRPFHDQELGQPLSCIDMLMAVPESYTQKKCKFDRPFHDQELGQPLSCIDMLMAVPESYTQKKCKSDRPFHDQELGQPLSCIDMLMAVPESYTQKKCKFDRPFHDQELGQPLSCIDMLMAVPESYTQKKCKSDRPFHDQELGQPLSCSDMLMAVPEHDYGYTSASPDISFGLQHATKYMYPQDSESSVPSVTLVGSQSSDPTLSYDAYSDYSALETIDEKHRKSEVVRYSNSSFGYQCPLGVKSLSTLPQLNRTGLHSSAFDMKSPPSIDVDISQNCTQMSSRLKRKKAHENDGFKHCSCRKSKCLKLYCDCFAAGQYCGENCSCQQCQNRTDNVDEISEAREKIESRNPIAFAPKVIMEHTKEEEDGKHATPIAGRHKRGCNCKKSQCIKNYCECYQAQIGCFSGCRCSGCKNNFGRKEGVGKIDEIEHKCGGGNDGMLEEPKQFDTYLSPHTPFVQGSKYAISVPVGYYSPPESSASISSSYTKPRSSIDSIRNNMFAAARENSAPIPYVQVSGCHSAAKVEAVSHGFDGVTEASSFPTCSSNPPSTYQIFSTSENLFDNIQQPNLLDENQPPLDLGCWNSLTVTPNQCDESKFAQKPDSCPELHGNLDTPDNLQDDFSPNQTVETISCQSVTSLS